MRRLILALAALALCAGCASAKLAAIRAAREAVERAREKLADPKTREKLAEEAMAQLDRAAAKLGEAEADEADDLTVDADAPGSQAPKEPK